jgi:hypothetical protein
MSARRSQGEGGGVSLGREGGKGAVFRGSRCAAMNAALRSETSDRSLIGVLNYFREFVLCTYYFLCALCYFISYFYHALILHY